MRINELLFEMPVNIGDMDSVSGMYADTIRYIKRFKSDTIVDLPNNLKKHSEADRVYYWYEKDGSILIAVVMAWKDNGLNIRTLVKNPYHTGSPHATDLYSAIRKDQPRNVNIVSDYSMTEDGFKVWKRLFNSGHSIGVIKYNDPEHKVIPIKTMEEMMKYFSEDEEDRVSSFVLLK